VKSLETTLSHTASLAACEATNRLYKVMVLVYKSLHRFAPPYLSDDCQLLTDIGRRHLRSADVHTCTVPQTQSRLGDRSFGSPDHGCGTVCPLNCDSKTFASPSLGGYWRQFCSLRLGALRLLCFNGAGYKHSYLLTYILWIKDAAMFRLITVEN